MKRAAAPPNHLLIRASAGTGKTYALSNRFLALVYDGAPTEQVLASTFARKAAGEIAARVLFRLAEAALDPKKLDELAQAIERPELTQPRCRQLLCGLLNNLHALRIGTLDSFFVQLAHHYSLELGIIPGWSIADDLADQQLRQEAIREALKRRKPDELVTLLNLLSHGEVRRSVAQELADLVKNSYAQFRDTPAEAWKSLERPPQLTDDRVALARDRIAGLALPANKHWENARRNDLENLESENWHEFLTKGIAKAVANGEPKFQRVAISPTFVDAYQPMIEHARACLMHQLANRTWVTYQLLAAFQEQYTALKRERGLYRFDDLPHLLADAWTHRRIDRTTYRLDAYLLHLLLDEFQDTSLDQWRAIEPLVRDVTDPARRGSFFCVGDVKQAIYGWRGGEARLFDAVAEQVPAITEMGLTKSYRSSPPVIDTVNRVFETLSTNAALRDDKDPQRWTAARQRWINEFKRHETAKTELAGYCTLAETAAPVDENENADDAHWHAVAARVRELARQHPQRTVGVLVRKNEAVSDLIRLLAQGQDALLASEEGGNPLTDSAAVRIVLALLHLIDHPGDTVARFQVARSALGPRVGIVDHANGSVAWQVRNRLREELTNQGYAPSIRRWAAMLAAQCDRRELGRLQQLVELAEEYDTAPGLRTDRFVEHVEATKVDDPTTARVRVMTIHQSKGLQFDVVVLPQLDEPLKGQPPNLAVGRDEPTGPVTRVCRWVDAKVRPVFPKAIQQMHDDWEDRVVGESLCTLYVAMTRAVHALHLFVKPRGKGARGSTFAALVHEALVDANAPPVGALLYEHGSRNWDDRVGDKGQPTDSTEKFESLVVKLASAKRRRVLEHTSPSQLEGGSGVKLRQVFQVESAARARGTLLHAWFELVEWLDDGEPSDDALRQAAADLRVAASDLPATVAEFRVLLQKPNLRRALSRAAYQDLASLGLPAQPVDQVSANPWRFELLREQPFAIRSGDTLLRGAIDRLVLIYRGNRLLAADVLDFKTDRVEASTVAERVAFYKPQLEAYRQAVQQLYGLDASAVAARLAMVELDALYRV